VVLTPWVIMYASKGKEDEQAKEASPEEEILADKKRLAK
jgi:hypothetical protein